MTMIELLTVVVLIGLLTAIAVPAYFQHRDRARDGVAVINLLLEEKALEGVDLSVPLALEDTYTVRVQSETGNTFDITENDDGTVDLTCASADDAGCPSDGTWD